MLEWIVDLLSGAGTNPQNNAEVKKKKNSSMQGFGPTKDQTIEKTPCKMPCEIVKMMFNIARMP